MSHKEYEFGHTFDRQEIKEKKDVKNSGLLSDICDLCNKFVENIVDHLKKDHPKEYFEMF